MARYKPIAHNPRLLPVVLCEQIQLGTASARPKKTAGEVKVLIANITASLRQPVAGFGVFAQPR